MYHSSQLFGPVRVTEVGVRVSKDDMYVEISMLPVSHCDAKVQGSASSGSSSRSPIKFKSKSQAACDSGLITVERPGD